MISYNTTDYGNDFFYINPFMVWPKNSGLPTPTAISNLKVPYKGIYQVKKLIFKLLMENEDWVFINATQGSLSYNDKLPNFLYTLESDGGTKDPDELYIGTKALREILEKIREGEKRCNIQC